MRAQPLLSHPQGDGTSLPSLVIWAQKPADLMEAMLSDAGFSLNTLFTQDRGRDEPGGWLMAGLVCVPRWGAWGQGWI